MDSPGEISSSEDEFDLELLKFETDCIHVDISDQDSESTDEENEESQILESESEDESASTDWTPCEEFKEPPPRIKFSSGDRPEGANVPKNLEQPLDFFKLFFTEELIDRIITETNSYAEKKLEGRTLASHSVWKTWREVTREEFLAFLAVVVNMGTMPLANLQEYWSKKDTSHIPFYPNTFTRDRFTQIFWMLHVKLLSGRSANPATRLQLINGYLDYINGKLLDFFTPGEQICMNESIVKLDGKVSFVTYNPRKATEWGIRMYTLVDSNTGYVFGILPYYGHITSETTMMIRPDLPTSARIPLHLYVQLLHKIPTAQGHHMFTDRCWTSCTLADELRKLKCHLTGKLSKQEVPQPLRKSNCRKKSTMAYRRGNNLVLRCKDKKIVTLLTNWHGADITTAEKNHKHGVRTVVKKPEVVMSYARYKGGSDSSAATYCFMKKSLKWWRKLFFWGLEICLIDSYLLYKSVKKQTNQKPVSRLQFRKTLVDELRGEFRHQRERVVIKSEVDPDEIRLDGRLHLMLKGTKKDCKVCSNRSKPGGRRETTYFCDTCPDKPRMHIGACFLKYHTKQKYRNL